MRNFMKSNTFSLIVSIVAAILLWMYVAYEVTPSYEKVVRDVTVSCINKSDLFSDGSLEIRGENDKLISGGVTVDIRIKGKRNAVSAVDASDVVCTVDMITVNRAGTYSIKPSVEIDRPGIEIMSITPKNIKFNVESIGQKNVEVKLKIKGSLPDGYDMENIKTNITNVKATGPETVIDLIDHAEIVLDYSALEVTDSEKSLELVFKNEYGDNIDASQFSKSFEYAKVSFDIYTTREVSVILMPKYKDEIKQNAAGTGVLLTAVGDKINLTKNGGIKKNVKLRGTAAALESYTNSVRTVYTDPIDVSGVYVDAVIENVKAAPLANNIDYVDVPEIDVKLTMQIVGQ